MEDGQIQEIEVNGMKVQEIISSGYKLLLFANSKDFPNLNGKLKEAAETGHRQEEPLAYNSYYPSAPDTELPHAVGVSTWKPEIERLTWNADKERIATSEGAVIIT